MPIFFPILPTKKMASSVHQSINLIKYKGLSMFLVPEL